MTSNLLKYARRHFRLFLLRAQVQGEYGEFYHPHDDLSTATNIAGKYITSTLKRCTRWSCRKVEASSRHLLSKDRTGIIFFMNRVSMKRDTCQHRRFRCKKQASKASRKFAIYTLCRCALWKISSPDEFKEIKVGTDEPAHINRLLWPIRFQHVRLRALRCT